jgi:hypothetical protein
VGDRASKRAARWATLVAVPVALLAGFGAFAALGGLASGEGSPEPSPSVSGVPRATGPVTVAAPPLSARAEVVCRALLSQLPDALRDRNRRPVTAGAEQNAAYGDPAITVACGVPTPSFPATDNVYPLNGVCWHAAEQPAQTVWTTVDREVQVRVTVPRPYEAPGQWVIEFSGPVIAAVPSATDDVPSGCRRP